MIVAIGVHKEGSGYSAFGYEANGKKHRLSPTWVRDVMEDRLQEFDAPMKNEPKRTVRVRRMAPLVTGKKLVTGESLVVATERAKRALEGLAIGEQPHIPGEKVVRPDGTVEVRLSPSVKPTNKETSDEPPADFDKPVTDTSHPLHASFFGGE